MAHFKRSEAEALAAITGWDGLIIVDFDETLFLRNSTEEFLDSARPALLAALLLRLLDLGAPWRWTGGATTRDVWRVRAVARLFPWTMRRWQARSHRLADLANRPLLAALRARGEPFIVASFGFSAVIRPLLDSLGCEDVPLIACALAKRDRQRGKLSAIRETIGDCALAGAMVITDSPEDAAVLEACALPSLTVWRAARFGRALRRVYLPGDYLVHVKRPGQAGVFRRLMTDDLALWILISAPGLGLRFLAGVAALFLSLWSIYEIGYRENDLCAARLEIDPVVSPQFGGFDTPRFELKAWISAILLALVGAQAVRPAAVVTTVSIWLAVLIALRAIYWLYNRIDKLTRAWLYLALHLFRTLALAAVVPIGIVGMMAGVTQICARWQEYLWYRLGWTSDGFFWRDTPLRLIQLLLLLLCLGALARAGLDVWTWRSAALVAWSVALARKDIRAAIEGAHRLDRGETASARHDDCRNRGVAGRSSPEERPIQG